MSQDVAADQPGAKPRPKPRGITGNAMERARAVMAEQHAKKAAQVAKREARAAERERAARKKRAQRTADRQAVGLNKRGHPRVHTQTVKSKQRAAKRAEYAAKREAAIAAGEIVPRKPKSRAGYTIGKPNVRSNRTLIRELRASIPDDQWERVLQAQPVDGPGGALLAIMSDPRMSGWSLERQCAEANLKFQDLVRMVSDHSLGSALVASTRHVHEVVEGVAESAKSRMLVCELCLGLRDDGDEYTSIVVAHPRVPDQTLKLECPKCGGVGRVRKEGSPRAVETFLKLHGGLEEQQGPTVNVNTQLNFGSQHATGVQRGQQLLEQGRQRRSMAQNAPITVTATRIDSPNGASE
jgi:hypothetical protein